jgi:hypothetical protein
MGDLPIILKTGLGGFGAFFGAAEAPAFASVGPFMADGPVAGSLGIAEPSLLSAIDGVCVYQKKVEMRTMARAKSGRDQGPLTWPNLALGLLGDWSPKFTGATL